MNWPLMQNNIRREDLTELRYFLGQGGGDIPRLTNGDKVREFEAAFAKYIGTQYAVMVNSGASANLVTMAAVHHLFGPMKVMTPTIAWVSDVTSVLQAGHTPEFMEVDPRTLGMRFDGRTWDSSVLYFPTHTLGFNALPEGWPLHQHGLLAVEDCCEALGAMWQGRMLGSLGLASNFSFYYAHHMTTVEGGMICTSDRAFYNACRMIRGHGLLRECDDADYRAKMAKCCPDLDPQFIFMMPGYNVRPTEIQAVLGLAQLPRLDENVSARTSNLRMFLSALNPDRYRTDYRISGSSNYALPLILNEKNDALMGRVLDLLRAQGVEYRRGTAGGGNQLRQPYLRKLYGDLHKQFPQAEHIHEFGLYLGNYPGIHETRIFDLCQKLNAL